jgi:hypothetical protein
MLAAIAEAVTGPRPGMVIRRRATLLSRAIRLHEPVVFSQNLWVHLELDTKHQFLTLFSGFDAFWRELRIGRNEANRCRDDIFWNGIGNDARLVAKGELTGIIGGKVERHVDIVQIEDRQNALACRDYLAGAGEVVLHASAPGGDEHQIDQNRLESFDIGLGRLDCELGLIALGAGRKICGIGRLELIPTALNRDLCPFSGSD